MLAFNIFSLFLLITRICPLLCFAYAWHDTLGPTAMESIRQMKLSRLGVYHYVPSKSSSFPCTTISASSSSNNDYDAKNVENYVLNVHGGKYRFDDPSSGGTSVGRDFAQSLYSSSYTEDQNEVDSSLPLENWPKWAKRMVSISSVSLIPKSSYCSVEELTISLDELKEKRAKLFATIHNQYWTWEPYYAKIIPLMKDSISNSNNPNSVEQLEDISSYSPYEIIGPSYGTLSPKGGSDNLCDSNNPYPDSASICVQFLHKKNFFFEHIQWCLAAGTEEENWYFLLNIT